MRQKLQRTIAKANGAEIAVFPINVDSVVFFFFFPKTHGVPRSPPNQNRLFCWCCSDPLCPKCSFDIEIMILFCEVRD
jgi:hypothetical protein